VDRRLCHFAADATPGVADIRFEYVSGAQERPPSPLGPSRRVYDPSTGEVTYFEDGELLWIDLAGRAAALCNCNDGEVRVWTARPDDFWLASRPLLTLPLVEILKRRGLFSLHAAGVSAGAKAILIAGPSGSGKTTLALALLGAGFDLIGDDMTFLRRNGSKPRVLAFPDEVDVTDKTLELLPSLRSLSNRGLDPGWPKYRFRAEELLHTSIANDAEPAVIVFPRLVPDQGSRVEEMTADEALVELAPNVLLTAAAPAQMHLDALAELAAASRCYRLHAGSDLGAARDLVSGLVP
jgi:hypothetical protein